jgi:phospholipid-translocating ATPase
MRVCDAVKAIALCHNVTPVYEAVAESLEGSEQSDTEADQQSQQRVSYQASSPDEVCFIT